MTAQQFRKVIEKKRNVITQKKIDECILRSSEKSDKRNDFKGKNCYIQNRVNQCIERKGLTTEF